MILTVHLLAGAALSAKIKIIPLSLFLAFLSHYFLDALPHREYSVNNIRKRNWKQTKFEFLKIILDFSFGVFLIFLLAKQGYSENNLLLMFIGGFFGVLADGFTFLYCLFPKNYFFEKHYYFQQKIIHPLFFKKERISLFWGIFIQIFVVIFFAALLWQ